MGNVDQIANCIVLCNFPNLHFQTCCRCKSYLCTIMPNN